MQGIRANRRKIIFAIICVILLIGIDQGTKYLFRDIYYRNGRTTVIDGFFYFSYTFNTGSAYGLLSSVSWGQLFFKILTPIALVVFCFFYYYAIKHEYKALKVALLFTIAGSVGNFIDRVINNGVIDFLTIEIGNVVPFGIFNVADIFMTVGVILIIVHLLFLDKNSLFGGKKDDGKKDDGKKVSDKA